MKADGSRWVKHQRQNQQWHRPEQHYKEDYKQRMSEHHGLYHKKLLMK